MYHQWYMYHRLRTHGVHCTYYIAPGGGEDQDKGIERFIIISIFHFVHLFLLCSHMNMIS